MDWNIIGHDWAADMLSEHIASDRLRHAYLFTGPPGIGRRTLAIKFAQAINCLTPPHPGECCGKCRACNLTENMTHPDIAVIHAESVGGILKVDAIRDLQHSLSLTPFEAVYRIAILMRFDEANASAANALLKTLEEPAPRVILILTAENSESLLPTIVSRCEILRLRPLLSETIERWLVTKWELSQEKAHLIAAISSGRPGYAYRLAKDDGLLNQRTEWLQDLQELLFSDRVNRFAYADMISKDKEILRTHLPVWLSYWHDILMVAAGSGISLSNPDWQEQIIRTADRVGSEKARQVVSALLKTMTYIDKNVNPRLAVEVLLMDLPKTIY